MEEARETRRPDAGGSGSAALPVETPPLTSVAVVCRSHTSIAAIPAIIANIDAFVDATTQYTIPRACEVSVTSVQRLLARIAAREDPGIDPFHKRSLFSAGIAKAAARGDLDVVRWFMEVYLPTGRVRGAVEKAAGAGQLHILKWLHARHNERVVWGARELHSAVFLNHVETARWLYDNVSRTLEVENELIRAAIESRDSSDVVEWLWEIDRLPPIDHDNLLRAARQGNIALLEWAVKRLDVTLDQRCMDVVVRTGNLRLMEFLASLGGPAFSSVDADALCEGVRDGNLDVIEWSLRTLTVRNKSDLAQAIDSAAKRGRLDIVKKLHQECPGECSVDAMNSAAAFGHLEIVQWLHDHRSEGCSTAAMDRAAGNGHLEVVKWMHANRMEGCTSAAMDSAAANGHLHIAQWLHENRNESCTARAIDTAARNGLLDVV